MRLSDFIHWQSVLEHIQAMCGNPSPADACRNVIQYCEELKNTLKGEPISQILPQLSSYCEED